MSEVAVEVYALSDMNTALRKLNVSTAEVLAQARQAIEAEKLRLQDIERERHQKFERCRAVYEQCQAAYDQCLSSGYYDKDGYYHQPNCTSEQYALVEAKQVMADAEEALKEVQNQIKLFTDQIESYSHQAIQLQQAIEIGVGEARVYLEKHIQAGLDYLWSHPDERSVPGAGTHGSLYRAARREWFERGAAGELQTESRAYQGWMRNEVRRNSSYYHSVAYHDVGHRVPSVDIPENFRWELSHDNRRRPRIAQRYGVSYLFR